MSAEAPVKHQSRTKAEQRAESLEQILDAAEFLFSKNGLHGVTLRDVAVRVGIHTTLLNYYFKDKVNLFEAVFARRAGVTSGRRMVALEQYEQSSGDKPTVEGARLMPALQKARAQANWIKCQSNLHQIGVYLTIYSFSWRGACYPPNMGAGAPTTERWPGAIWKSAG